MGVKNAFVPYMLATYHISKVVFTYISFRLALLHSILSYLQMGVVISTVSHPDAMYSFVI